MNTIKNICKHNTFFKLTFSEGRYFNKLENEIIWESIYGSNEIHNHQVNEELINYIKPFLYYLASKNINREGEGCGFQAIYEVGVCWKNMYCDDDDYDDGYYYQGTTPLVVMIGGKDGLTMKVISNDHDYNYEGQTPFEIELKMYQTYYLPAISIKEPYYIDECVTCLSNKPDILFTNCLHHCVCLECETINPFKSCPYCKNKISMKIKI